MVKVEPIDEKFYCFFLCVLGGKILEVLWSEIVKEWGMGLDEMLEFMKEERGMKDRFFGLMV